MSGHVASQTNGLPCFHGTMVTPSGHLPSERSRPDRSNLDGILADDRARYRTSLMLHGDDGDPYFSYSSSHEWQGGSHQPHYVGKYGDGIELNPTVGPQPLERCCLLLFFLLLLFF